jgi:hypothetical protein
MPRSSKEEEIVDELANVCADNGNARIQRDDKLRGELRGLVREGKLTRLGSEQIGQLLERLRHERVEWPSQITRTLKSLSTGPVTHVRDDGTVVRFIQGSGWVRDLSSRDETKP